LIYEILKASGKKVMLAGNIGTSPLDFLPQQKKYPLAVLELSSFQLQDLKKSPEVAVVLDIFPDHQDAHADLKEYYDAKKNIGRWQKKDDKIFYFLDNKNSQMVAEKSPAKKIGAGTTKFSLFLPNDLKIPGPHNFKNAVMASLVVKNLGVSNKTIIQVVKKFKGLPHRLQFVRKIGNTSFYDDSASTNPNTTAAALQSFRKSFLKRFVVQFFILPPSN
jgi:UDP-N-acetylmuramoylalanine--D-glutamate ligase